MRKQAISVLLILALLFALSPQITLVTSAATISEAANSIPDDAAEHNGHYYMLYNDASSFDEAQQKCVERGGHLATLTSADENSFVYSYIVSRGVKSAYFGYSDAEKEGTWKWVTGETAAYTNWHRGEPNGENSREDYAMFYYKFSDGTWNDGDFGGSTVNGGINYICEWSESGNNRTFKIGRDNNSFVHNDSSPNSGFYKVKNYDFLFSDFLRLKQTAGFTNSDVFTLIKQAFSKWKGSCFGIASTIAMNYNGNYDISTLSSTSVDYFHMELPWRNKSFLYTIQYYQVSQYITPCSLDKIGLAYHTNPNYESSSRNLHDELRKIVDALSESDKVMIFPYGYETFNEENERMENHGHAIVAYDCVLIVALNSDSDPYYLIHLYDENGFKTSNLIISADYNDFWFTDGSGNHIGSSEKDGIDYNYNWISLIDPDDIPVPLPTAFDQRGYTYPSNNFEESDYLQLSVSADNDFIITNSYGETLIFENNCFGGTMHVYETSHILTADSTDSVVFYIDPSEEFHVTTNGGKICISTSYNDKYSALEGKNLYDIKLSPGESVVMEGDEYTYEVFLSGMDTSQDSGLVSIRASCDSGRTVVSTDSGILNVTAENTLHGIVTSSYDDLLGIVSIIQTDCEEFIISDESYQNAKPCTDSSDCLGVKFTDMPQKGNWAHDPIDWALANGITSGTSDTTFSPKKTCTREQIVTFLWKAAGAPEPKSTENPFSDVKRNKYYYKAVLWAVENSITSGVGDGKFGVGQGCTRAQAMTFLWIAAGKPAHSQMENPFSDVKPGKYYYDAILWAVENGVTSGVGDGKFGVGQTCTRAQIVTFLYKAFHLS